MFNPVKFFSSSIHRVFPTSTMDLVDLECATPAGIQSTWQYYVESDFCPSTSRPIKDSREDSDAALWGRLVDTNAKLRKNVHVVTRDLDFIEAREKRHSFDKILLLVKHCDHTIACGALTEPSLTEEGAGQALNLARRVSTFCNDETQFRPELVVVAPLRRSIQTTLLSFPQFSPHTVRAVPWICHPATTGSSYDVQDLLQLQKEFTGLEYAPCYGEIENRGHTTMTSPEDLLKRADFVLSWLREQEQKIVVRKCSGV